MPQKARVLYAFTAENPEEMSLGEGELITVTNMVCFEARCTQTWSTEFFFSIAYFSTRVCASRAEKQ
jgi:hypothetical protein